MIADASFYDYVHPGHFMLFVEAARKFACHILVRKTGAASISWMGKPGYTGKRGMPYASWGIGISEEGMT